MSRTLAILLLLILIAGKVAAVLARGPAPLELDAWQYWRLSTLVLNGDWLMFGEPVAYRTPLYPWFLAAVRAISGPAALPMIVGLQGVLCFASVCLAGVLAARFTKLPWAFPMTLLASLPAVSGLTFGTAILSETLFVFVLMVHLLAVLAYGEDETTERAAVAGITFGLTLMTRPIVLLLWIPHLVLVLLLGLRRNQRQRRLEGRREPPSWTLHVVTAGLLALATISPWLMRNHFLFGKPFLTEFVGRNAWVVTFQDGSGAGLELPSTPASARLRRRLAYVGVTEGWQHTWTVATALVRSGMSDPSADQLMKQVSWDAIRASPRPFATKTFRRIVNFWRCSATDLPQPDLPAGNYRGQLTWHRPTPAVERIIQYRWSRSVWLNTLLTVVVGGAVILLILNRPTRPHGIWLALILAYFAVVTGTLEIPAYRYRMVLEPIAAMAVGSAVAVLLSWRRRPTTPGLPDFSKSTSRRSRYKKTIRRTIHSHR